MELKEYEERVNRGFTTHNSNGLVYLSVPAVDKTGVFRAVFTTRLGGVSPAPYDSLNLSVTRENNPLNKLENLRRAAAAAGSALERMVLVNYEHGCQVVEIGPDDAGKGFGRSSDLPPCDALLVHCPNVTAVTLHADCVPVFIVDPVLRAGTVGHAGWKGTLSKLPLNMLRALEEAGADISNLVAAIGPHIRGCCFEVGEEVADAFEQEFGDEAVVRTRGKKPSVSLERAILWQLMGAGLAPEQITLSGDCTYCRPELYYSHRRDKGHTGAMGSFLTVLGP